MGSLPAHSGSLRTAAGIALASLAVIGFQLFIMQALSLAQWHHFAYMVISMAMLGFGAAGTVLVLWRQKLQQHYHQILPFLYLAAALSMAAAVPLSRLGGQFDIFLLFFEYRQFAQLLLTYLIYCLPFFFAGLAITLVFYCEVENIGSLYFANMAGSGVGALLMLGLLWLLPLGILPVLLGLLLLLAAWIKGTAVRGFRACLVLTAVLLGLGLFNPVLPEPSEYKDISASLLLPGAEVVHRSHSPWGQLEVVSADALRFAPALSLQYRGEPPVRDVMYVNGEYFGTLLGPVATDQQHVLDYSTRGLGFALRPAESMLVLNAASGTDVSHGLYHGVQRIDAIDANHAAVRLLRDVNPHLNAGLFLQPGVSVHTGSARSFLAAQAGQDYDRIILPVLGSFGGGAGVHALQEQYELTAEAFMQMWQRLSPSGMISATVWLDYPARPALRLLASWRELLQELGIDDPLDHLLAVRSWGTITFLLSRLPFSAEEIENVRRFARDRGFDPLIMRGLAPAERERFNRSQDSDFFLHVDTLLHGDTQELYRQYPFNVRPASDNRPFFSQYLRWQSLPELRAVYGDRSLPYTELGYVLALVSFAQITLVAVVLIILPLFRVGWQGSRRRWTLLYFAGTGLGFLLFEIVLIQQLLLYLGNPAYSTALVLACLLIASGLGSYRSSRLPAEQRQMLGSALLVALLVLLCAVLLLPLLQVTMAWPMLLKMPLVLLALALPAYFMGRIFPLGLRRLAVADRSHIPWACGIDSCMSVTATALASLLALELGFTAVSMLAAFAYAGTALAVVHLGSTR